MLLLIGMLIVEGTWAVRLYHSWSFVSVVLVVTLFLLVAALMDIRHRRYTPFFSHAGLALILLSGMLGAVTETDCKMVVDAHATERVAYTKHGESVVLPFSLQLRDFRVEYYPDSVSPKQYTSTLDIRGEEDTIGTCSVNHPLRYHGWWIYQSDYDRANRDFVILQLVRDPWLPGVYLGFVLLVLSVLLQLRSEWGTLWVFPVVIAVAALFTWISLARIEMKTLVPALRSVWFFPHILIYMVAYSLMAIAWVMSIVRLFGKCPRWITDRTIHRMMTVTSALLLLGMLCGSVWAKDAWGQYWTWDAKECWAAVTWLTMVIGRHLPSSRWVRVVTITLAFAAMQITWYGVNYLPSAQYSMHTYNRK